jgi:hypothetical protein
MFKRKFQLLSLLLSVVALVYLYLEYYGYIRMYKLKNTNCEYYINKYNSLPKADKQRVIITFHRPKGDIKPFINSILDQTVRVDDIGMTLNSKEKVNIPEQLKKIINIYTYEKDYKDAGIAICSVLREPESDTKIIILNPNKIYGIDFIQSIVEKSNENPDKIVLLGKDKNTYLIKPKFFTENFCNYEEGYDCLKWIEKQNKDGTVVIEYNDMFNL